MGHFGCCRGSVLAVFWHFLCLETIVNEKGEHVFFVDSCVFSKDFQGPQGTENRNFDQKLTSWDMRFFGRHFGSQFCHFWVTFWRTLTPQNEQKLTPKKQQKTRAHFGRKGGGDAASFPQAAEPNPWR